MVYKNGAFRCLCKICFAQMTKLFLYKPLVDFQDANMCQTETLIKDVLQQLKLKVPTPCDLADFSSVLKKLNQPTVILMDDIRAGIAAPALDTAFWLNLCALGNRGYLSFVVTASESLEKLVSDFGERAPFFNLFGHILQLGALTESEALDLLANSPKPFSPEEVAGMLKKSGCWAETLQMLCDVRLQQLSLNEKMN